MNRRVAQRIYELTEQALAADNASLQADVDSYRALAQTALAHVAALTTRNDRLVEQNRDLRNANADLRDELKALRAFLMEQDIAA